MIKHFNQKHGMRKTRFYSIWLGMKTRCLNKKHQAYKHYGGKGILVCEEWKVFENFMKDMYKTYQQHQKQHGEKNTSIDRINGNLGYNKKNCRWATKTEQSNNSRNNIKIKHKGQEKTLLEWSRKFKISYGTLWQRIYKLNMPTEEAFKQINFRINKRIK